MNLPTIVSRVAFGVAPDVALPAYTDVSESVLAFQCHRGRSDERAQTEPGTATVTYHDPDRRFDSTNTGSPFWPNVTTTVKMQHAAVYPGLLTGEGVDTGGDVFTGERIEYPLHTGYNEDWPIQWQPPGTYQTTSAPITDAFGPLALANVSGSFPEQSTGARISMVLQAISWPTSSGAPGTGWTLDTSLLGTTTMLAADVPLTVVAPGLSTVQALDVPDDQPVSALSVIQDAAKAEAGVFFIAADGTAVFEDRITRYLRSVAATFSDRPTGADIQYEDLTPRLSKVMNDVTATSTIGGTPVTAVASDPVSVAKHFRISAPTLNVPLTSLSALQDRASYELLLYATPFERFDRMVVRPAGQPSAWPTVLGLDIGDKVTITRTPARGAPIVRTCFIESVDHAVTRDEWTVTFDLSPGEQYQGAFVLGTAQLDSVVNAHLVY